MTNERDFDRLAGAWLELGPNEAPDRVVAAVLQAAETTPQVRRPGRWPFWRSFPMNRFSIAAIAAVLVAVVGGGIILTRGGDQGVGGPVTTPATTATPTPVPSPSASGSPVSSSLIGRWMGGNRLVPGIDAGGGSSIAFTDTAFTLGRSNQFNAPLMVASASESGDGRFRVVATSSDATGCEVGATGDYQWTLTAGGRHLAIQAIADDCAGRLAAIPGDWVKMACKNTDDNCLGDLAAGTYGSQSLDPRLQPGTSWDPVYGGVMYTVPDGWANSADWPAALTLTPSANYAAETKDGPPDGVPFYELGIRAQPAASTITPDCAPHEKTDVPRTVEGLIGWLRSAKPFVVSAPTSITIDGHTGQWVDVSLAPAWTSVCPGFSEPGANPLIQSNAQNPWDFTLVGPEKTRFIFLDLGGGSVVMLCIDAGDGTKFDALVAQAMPIVQSMTFK